MHKHCKCRDCENTFEVEVSKEDKENGAKDNLTCPSCESTKIEAEEISDDWECCQGTKDAASGCHCC